MLPSIGGPINLNSGSSVDEDISNCNSNALGPAELKQDGSGVKRQASQLGGLQKTGRNLNNFSFNRLVNHHGQAVENHFSSRYPHVANSLSESNESLHLEDVHSVDQLKNTSQPASVKRRAEFRD